MERSRSVRRGAAPASAVSGRLAQRISGHTVRCAFAWLLIVSGSAFVVFRLHAQAVPASQPPFAAAERRRMLRV